MRTRSVSRLGWFLPVVMLGACSSGSGPSTAPGPGATSSEPPSTSEPEADPERQGGGDTPEKEGDPRSTPAPPAPTNPPPDLYDPDTVPKFELTFDDAAMEILTSTNAAENETWVHGAFKFNAITFADVGVRRKGSATFRALPNKAPLKVKFNKWVKGQKLYGLKEITLNSMLGDPTFLAERLTYHVFRSLGLPAQGANTAELTINGDSYGIYANVETPDENFLERVFGAKARTLYELNSQGSTWLPSVSSGFEIDVPFPGAAPGTRPDADLLLNAVANAGDQTLLADLDAHLDTKQWLRFVAAEAVTGIYDGYAYGNLGYSHNYFMAGDTDGKFSLIPWSADLSLSDRHSVSDAANPPNATVFARCRLGTTCWNAFKAEMQSVLAAYEKLDLVPLAQKWHQQIDALVLSDPKREKSTSYYQQQVPRLYEWLAARPAVVRSQLGL